MIINTRESFEDVKRFLEDQRIPDRKSIYFTDSNNKRKLVVADKIYDAMVIYLGQEKCDYKYISSTLYNKLKKKNDTKN